MESSTAVERSVLTTYLEMGSAARAVPFRGERRLTVRRAEVPCPEFNRLFYHAVGADWGWYSRLAWTREQWAEIVERPELETWLGSHDGTPVGYFELERQPEEAVEIVHFGLLPSFVGQGFGRELLAAAVESAWAPGARRVWLHTCSLDHPRAIPNYLAAGFAVERTEEQMESVPEIRLWGGRLRASSAPARGRGSGCDSCHVGREQLDLDAKL